MLGTNRKRLNEAIFLLSREDMFEKDKNTYGVNNILTIRITTGRRVWI